MLPHTHDKGRYLLRKSGEKECEIYFSAENDNTLMLICKVREAYANSLCKLLQKEADENPPKVEEVLF